MRNIVFSGVIGLMLLACNGKNNVEIKGEIKDAGKQSVYLEQMNVEGTIVIDSAKTNKSGSFKFKLNVIQPTFYMVRVGNNEPMVILAEADQKIEISGQKENLKNNYWVDGSEGSLWIKLLNFQLNNTKNALDSIKQLYTALTPEEQNITRRSQLGAEWDSLLVKQMAFSRNFILQHATSPAAYYALYQKIDPDNFLLSPIQEQHSYRVVASSMKAMYPESQYTKAILNHYAQIENDVRNQKMRELIVSSENNLPEINLPNLKGDTVSLRSLKGKYILLDFSVLGSPESQAYISELKRIYSKYHSKGLEIYQVCLDPNKLQWEEAARKYDISWTCVRDANALESLVARSWNVQSIPANYIINKEYDIVGKNLGGRRLEDRLNDVIK